MLHIKIRSTDFDMTPAIEDYATKKIYSLGKFLHTEHEDVLCEVELGKTTEKHKSGDIFRAEVNIVQPGQQFYAVSEKEDLYSAIDMVREQIEREIVSKKEKRNTLFRRGAGKFKALAKRLYWK